MRRRDDGSLNKVNVNFTRAPADIVRKTTEPPRFAFDRYDALSSVGCPVCLLQGSYSVLPRMTNDCFMGLVQRRVP